jgi:hypothetical protein
MTHTRGDWPPPDSADLADPFFCRADTLPVSATEDERLLAHADWDDDFSAEGMATTVSPLDISAWA